ncbi:hypothetical protein NO134_22185, partial [Ochrobactrum sp. BD22]
KTPRHRQINSLQGDQKHHTISHVYASFFLSVVLRRNLPMGPIRQEMRPEQSVARALQEEMSRSQRLNRGIGMGM